VHFYKEIEKPDAIIPPIEPVDVEQADVEPSDMELDSSVMDSSSTQVGYNGDHIVIFSCAGDGNRV